MAEINEAEGAGSAHSVRSVLLYAIAAGLLMVLADYCVQLLVRRPVEPPVLQWLRSLLGITASGAALGVLLNRNHERRSLRRKAELFQAGLLRCPFDSVVLLNPDSRVLYASPSIERILGYSQAELTGSNAFELIHPDDWIAAESAFRCGPPLPDSGQSVVFRCRHKDGAWHMVEAEGSAIEEETLLKAVVVRPRDIPSAAGNGTHFVSTARDVAQRRLAEKCLQVQRVVTQALMESGTLERVIRTVLRAICEHLDCEVGVFWSWDEKANLLRCLDIWHGPSFEDRKLEGLQLDSFMATDVGLMGEVFSTQRPIWVADIRQRLDSTADTLAAKCGLRGAFGFPVAGRDKPPGVLVFFSREVRPLNMELVEMLAAIGKQIGLFVERKAAQAALKESERRYRALAEAAPEMIFVVDRDGRIQYANDCAAARFLTTPQQLAGRSLDSLFPGETVEAQKRNLRRTVETLQPLYVEAKAPFPEGELWLGTWLVPLPSDSGGATEVLGVARDITRQKLTEAALAESEERYRLFFEEDLSGDFIATPEGQLRACNAAFARIFGFNSVDEALGVNLWSLFPEPGPPENLLANLRNSRKLENYDLHFVRRDGNMLSIVGNIVGRFDSQGALQEIKGYLFDNTVRGELEKQLLQARRMEAVGRLTAGVAHEFNNLLAGIGGYAHLLLAEEGIEEKIRLDLTQIQQLVARAADLTRQLLTFGRQHTIQVASLNLNSVIEKIIAMLCRLVGTRIEVRFKPAPDLAEVLADAGQIQQVLVNLVMNARDAMPEGGTLVIETANVVLDQAYTSRHFEVQPGRYVMLAVADDGIGMDRVVQERIFDPFFTTKDVGQGTGLGLAAVYGSVKQHGGAIFVYSEPEKGTTLKVYLPVLEAGAAVPSDVAQRMKILVVEDQEAVKALVSTILEREGYSVLSATNCEDALELFSKHSDEIVLVVTDFVIAGCTGPQLYGQLAAQRPNLKVLYMSGYGELVLSIRGFFEPDTPFLAKPFTPAELVQRVRGLLAPGGS